MEKLSIEDANKKCEEDIASLELKIASIRKDGEELGKQLQEALQARLKLEGAKESLSSLK